MAGEFLGRVYEASPGQAERKIRNGAYGGAVRGGHGRSAA